MSKVKGALLLEYARLIRANKDKDWKKYLTEEDMQIICGSVMPNGWYPIEIVERAGEAVFQEVAQGKLENAWLWGKYVLEDIGKRFYHNLVRYQDPLGSLERIKTFIQQWYQFDDPKFPFIDVQQEAPTGVKMIIRYDHPFSAFEAYVHQLAGEFERMVELNGGKETTVKIVEHNYKTGEPFAVISVSWK